jgi:hypothetical protein
MALHITNQVFLKGLVQAAILTKWPDTWPMCDLHLNVPKLKEPIQKALQAIHEGTKASAKDYLKFFLETSVTGLPKDDAEYAHKFFGFCVEFVEGSSDLIGQQEFLPVARAVLAGSPMLQYFVLKHNEKADNDIREKTQQDNHEFALEHNKVLHEFVDEIKRENKEETMVQSENSSIVSSVAEAAAEEAAQENQEAEAAEAKAAEAKAAEAKAAEEVAQENQEAVAVAEGAEADGADATGADEAAEAAGADEGAEAAGAAQKNQQAAGAEAAGVDLEAADAIADAVVKQDITIQDLYGEDKEAVEAAAEDAAEAEAGDAAVIKEVAQQAAKKAIQTIKHKEIRMSSASANSKVFVGPKDNPAVLKKLLRPIKR